MSALLQDATLCQLVNGLSEKLAKAPRADVANAFDILMRHILFAEDVDVPVPTEPQFENPRMRTRYTLKTDEDVISDFRRLLKLENAGDRNSRNIDSIHNNLGTEIVKGETRDVKIEILEKKIAAHENALKHLQIVAKDIFLTPREHPIQVSAKRPYASADRSIIRETQVHSAKIASNPEADDATFAGAMSSLYECRMELELRKKEAPTL